MAALARRAIARAPAASPASSLHRVLGERATSLPVRARRALVARASSPGDPGWNDGSETISVALDRPMGIVLNSGRDGVGAYVAELVDGGNAAKDGSLRVGDVLLSCGTAADADEASSVVAKDFDDVMAALGADPDASAMRLTLKRFKDGPNRTKPEGRVWLEGNALRDGVTTTPSGLQYEVLESGSGPAGRVALDTKCECHYAGTLLDGTEFDSSYKRGKPLTFAPMQVIKGWTEAMRMMREGDKWRMYLPAELGYGGRGSGRFIKPGDVLVFEMQIIRVLG